MTKEAKQFKNYFKYNESYPQNLVYNPLELNVDLEYVSNTYLDAFINYVKIKKAYLIDRYTPWEEEFDEPPTIQVMDSPKSFNWIDVTLHNKQQLYDYLTQEHIRLSTKLREFSDDVIILANVIDAEKNDTNQWIYFWYDNDVSDCSIGRFETLDSEEVITDCFNKFVKDLDFTNGEAKEIPIHAFTGWITF